MMDPYVLLGYNRVDMNALLVILTLIFVAILIAVNIYILRLYVHADDKAIGTALYCKVLIVLGSTLFQAPALLVSLDVSNGSASLNPDGLDLKSFWFFLYLVVVVFVCFLLPFALLLYQTDGDQNCCKRFLKALLQTLAANIISMLLLFISFIFLKYADMPVHAVSADGVDSSAFAPPIDINTLVQTESDITFQVEVSFAVYVIAIMSFFGWILVVIFAGVGLSALPIDMINQFRLRPKARKSNEMKKNKTNLVRAINSLLTMSGQIQKSDSEQAANAQGGFLQRWRGKRNVEAQMVEFKAKYFSLEEQFQIFSLQLKFSDTNPIVPILKLILGIIFLITSLLWVLQIILANLANGYLGRPLIPFLNELLIGLDEGNAGFLATGLFFYLCLYLIWCVQKGTVKFGMRLPGICRFHPMREGETWLNSFIFNVILMLVASVGVIQLCISSFPTYTRNTQIYTIICLQLKYMKFYALFYQNDVFPIALIIWTGVAFIYMLATCNKKPPYMREIERIRNHEGEEDFAT